MKHCIVINNLQNKIGFVSLVHKLKTLTVKLKLNCNSKKNIVFFLLSLFINIRQAILYLQAK